jgi:hypothetical protein
MPACVACSVLHHDVLDDVAAQRFCRSGASASLRRPQQTSSPIAVDSCPRHGMPEDAAECGSEKDDAQDDRGHLVHVLVAPVAQPEGSPHDDQPYKADEGAEKGCTEDNGSLAHGPCAE